MTHGVSCVCGACGGTHTAGSASLNLAGKLLAGQKTVLSLSLAFQTAIWLTHIGSCHHVTCLSSCHVTAPACRARGLAGRFLRVAVSCQCLSRASATCLHQGVLSISTVSSIWRWADALAAAGGGD